MWIVTRAINQYEQDGEYFVAAYKDKPNFQCLKVLLPGETDATIGKLTRGGGRHEFEGEWFFLFEVSVGQHIDSI